MLSEAEAASAGGPSPLLATGTRSGRKQKSRGGAGAGDEVECDPASSPIDVRKMITFIVASYLLFMTAFIVPIACVSTVVLVFPFIFISMPLFLWLENGLCRFVNDHWVASSVFCGLQVVEYGEEIDKLSEKRTLFLANHLGLIDHFVLMNALHNKGTVSARWMWVIYNIWKFTPLGVMWTSHGNFFVNGGARQRELLLSKFRSHLRDFFWRFDFRWVVMYPEGSRLFMIRESGAKFAEKNGLSPLRHCVYPRTGAAHAVMEVAAPQQADETLARCGEAGPVEFIVDATIGYPKGRVSDMGSYLMGEWPLGDNRICVHYSVQRVRPEWHEEEKLKEFLYERYQKKDELLDGLYRTGQFPGGPQRPVTVSPWRVLGSQVFWLALYYAHYLLWLGPLCSFLFQYCTSLFF